jgi:amidase
MSQTEILEWNAAGTTAAIAAREISSREVVEAHFARLDEVNPRINAVVEVLREEALAAAGSVDASLARGEVLGPLAGAPITVKLNADIAGHAASLGLVALKNRIAGSDSPAVANLRKAGAVIVGRTNIRDFSLRWHTDSALHGGTVNPSDPRLTPADQAAGRRRRRRQALARWRTATTSPARSACRRALAAFTASSRRRVSSHVTTRPRPSSRRWRSNSARRRA